MNALQKIDSIKKAIDNAYLRGSFQKESYASTYQLRCNKYPISSNCDCIILISTSDHEDGVFMGIMFASIDRPMNGFATFELVKQLNATCRVGQFNINPNNQVGLVYSFPERSFFNGDEVVEHLLKMISAISLQIDNFRKYTWIYNNLQR